MKEDLAKMFKCKFGLDMGRPRLYRRSYSDSFDLVPYPACWCVPDFVKFSGDDNRSTWEHISQYVAQLGEAGSSNSLCVRLFLLSLTGTTFSWFFFIAPEFNSFFERIRTKIS